MNNIKLSLIILLFEIIEGKLLFVLHHFRHGSRGSVMLLKENYEDFFGNKWYIKGELTEVGMRMSYILGYETKQRYKNFLLNKYNPKDFLIYSTDLNRTLQTAYSYIYGLFSNIENDKLNEEQIKASIPPNKLSNEILKEIKNLKDNPIKYNIPIIPVHVTNIKDHFFLLHDPESVSDCKPIWDLRIKTAKENSFIQSFAKHFQSKYESKLRKYLDIKDNFDIFYIDVLCDHYISSKTNQSDLFKFHNITGIDEKEFEESCQNVLSIIMEKVVFWDKKITFMSQTHFVNKIIDWMERIIEKDKNENNNLNDYSSPKFISFSAHDTSTSAFMMFMKEIFNCDFINPTFSASIFFELHKKDNDLKGDLSDYYIKYFMNDKFMLSIDFEKFKNEATKHFWSDYEIEKFCEFKIINVDEKNKKLKLYFLIIITLLLIIVFQLFFLFIIFRTKKEKNTKEDGIELEEKDQLRET